jgi:hypothetical protein
MALMALTCVDCKDDRGFRSGVFGVGTYSSADHAYLRTLDPDVRETVFQEMINTGLRSYSEAYASADTPGNKTMFYEAYRMVLDAKEDDEWFPGVLVTEAVLATNEDGNSFLVIDCCEMSGGIDLVEVHVLESSMPEDRRIVIGRGVEPPHWDVFNSGFTGHVDLVAWDQYREQVTADSRTVFAPDERMVLPSASEGVLLAVRVRNLAKMWSVLAPVHRLRARK